MYKMSIKSLFILLTLGILGSVSSKAVTFPNATEAVTFPNTTVSMDFECKERTNTSCVQVKYCPTAITLSKDGKSLDENLHRCGYEGNDPLVCCPLKESTKIIYKEAEEIATRKPSKFTTIFEKINQETEVNTVTPELNSDPFPSRKICGQFVFVERITDGTLTSLEEFPWLARIKYRKVSGEEQYACAASLITNQYLLTAAHCLKDKTDNPVGVRLGEWDDETEIDCRSLICNDKPVDRNISKIFIYEGFDTKNNATGDIALIKLDKPVRYTKFIAPVCLPNTEYVTQQDYTRSSSYWTAGWGVTEFGIVAPIKRKVYLNAVSSDICSNIFTKIPKEYFETLICAGGIKGKDSCSGDSGGSLVKLVSEDYNNNWYLFGITSSGYGECGVEGIPGIYTRVTSYMQWIRKTIAENH